MSDVPDASERDAVARAVSALLVAVGAPVGRDREIEDTPQRVAAMYLTELLDGYRIDPATLLADGVASPSDGLVLLTHVRYVSMCPHHLLPAEGIAHLAYLPGERVVGLGTLVKLLEAFAHRLVLQETLGQQVADALVEHLEARGAGVVLRARHQCLSARGEKQGDAELVTMALAGSFAHEPGARAQFLAALAAGGAESPR